MQNPVTGPGQHTTNRAEMLTKQYTLLVTSPKVHLSEGSLVRKVTGPNSNPYPNCNPIPNPKVVLDLRNKETLNSFSYTCRKAIEKFGLVTLRTSEPAD